MSLRIMWTKRALSQARKFGSCLCLEIENHSHSWPQNFLTAPWHSLLITSGLPTHLTSPAPPKSMCVRYGPGKQRISPNGGGEPIWRRDGKELLYMTRGGTLMVSEVRLVEPLHVATPRVLFQGLP
jgi:hypothetical protein